MSETKEATRRRPIAGSCVDIDGASWHRDGQACEHCGFGIDCDPSPKGYWGEPIARYDAAEDLISALERLRSRFDALLARKPVRDVAETRAEVEMAIKKATGR